MPNSTPQFLKEEIVRLHLQGFSNAKVASSLDTSTGNVHNVIEQFKMHRNSGDYQKIRSFVTLCHKEGLKVSDAFEGFSTFSFLQKNNIIGEKLQEYVTLYLDSINDTISPSELAGYSVQLCQISSKTDMELEDIPNYYDSLLSKCNSLESKIQSMQKTASQCEDDIQKAMKNRDTSLKKLEEFVAMQKEMELLGLDVKDHESFAKMIRLAKSQNYNVSEITKYISQVKSFEEQILEQKREIANQESTINDYNNAIESKKEKLSDLTNKLNQSRDYYNDERKAITLIQKLSKKGITHLDIERWESARNKCKIDAIEFDEHIKNADEHLEFIENLKNKKEQLKGEIYQMQGNLSALKKELRVKESKIDKIDERLLQNAKIGYTAIENHVRKTMTKLSQLQEYHDVTIRSRIDNGLVKFEKDLNEFTPKLDETLTQLILLAEDKAKFAFLETLYMIFTEAKGQKNKVYLNMVQLLAGLEKWVKNSNESYSIEIDVKYLRKKFEEQLAKQAIAS